MYVHVSTCTCHLFSFLHSVPNVLFFSPFPLLLPPPAHCLAPPSRTTFFYGAMMIYFRLKNTGALPTVTFPVAGPSGGGSTWDDVTISGLVPLSSLAISTNSFLLQRCIVPIFEAMWLVIMIVEARQCTSSTELIPFRTKRWKTTTLFAFAPWPVSVTS